MLPGSVLCYDRPAFAGHWPREECTDKKSAVNPPDDREAAPFPGMGKRLELLRSLFSKFGDLEPVSRKMLGILGQAKPGAVDKWYERQRLGIDAAVRYVLIAPEHGILGLTLDWLYLERGDGPHKVDVKAPDSPQDRRSTGGGAALLPLGKATEIQRRADRKRAAKNRGEEEGEEEE